MKKILFVVDEKMIGGVSIVLEDILNKIDKTNNRIDLLVLHPVGDRFSNIKNINYIEGPRFYSVIDKSLKSTIKSKNIIDIFNKLKLIFLLKTGLIKNKIKRSRKKFLKDTYDVEIAFKDGFCTIFTAFGDSKKKITWLHTDYSNNDPAGHYRKLFRDSLYKLDTVVAISNEVKNKFNNVYGLNTRTIIINNYIDIDKVISNSNQENVKYDGNLNFVTVGRLCYVKGYDRLLSALDKLNKEKLLTGIRIYMVGTGEDEFYLKNKIIDYSLQQVVTFMGKKDNPYPYIKSADMMIMSSRSEAYPLTVIESLILEVPVFTVEYSSAREMLKDRYNSYIVPNNDEDIYIGLKNIIQNRNIIKEYKENLKKDKYTNKAIIEQIEDLWR